MPYVHVCDLCSPRGCCSAAGGENGFNQAIELSADTLANVKFVQEKRLISKFFDEISQDTSKFVFGVADTLQCLEMGAVETLVVWEDLQVYRYTLMNSTSGNMSAPIGCLYFELSGFKPCHLLPWNPLDHWQILSTPKAAFLCSQCMPDLNCWV